MHLPYEIKVNYGMKFDMRLRIKCIYISEANRPQILEVIVVASILNMRL